MKLIRKIFKGLDLFCRCMIRHGDEEFRHLVLSGYQNPNFLELRNYGNEYGGKVVYHIEEYGKSVGFFAEFLYLLMRLYYAAERGFVPCVYWGEDFLYYEKGGIEGEKNAFLHYFDAVSEVFSIDKAKYVLEATSCHINDVQDCLNAHGYAVSDEYIEALGAIIRKYIHYNKKTMEYLNESYDKLIGDQKTLAVHFRGTDYRRQYADHPVFVTIKEEIEKVRELLNSKGYEAVFLATDEQEAVDIFRREFGEKVKIFEDTWRAQTGDESVAYSYSDRENHHYLLGLEVLRDQYMLTRCDGLVCGISNLTLSARMMRIAWYDKEYEDLVVISNGLCDNQNYFCDAKH